VSSLVTDGYTCLTSPATFAPAASWITSGKLPPPSPLSPPLKGGEIIYPSPLEGEGMGEGVLLINSFVFSACSGKPSRIRRKIREKMHVPESMIAYFCLFLPEKAIFFC
jgi:hypothetical protein